MTTATIFVATIGSQTFPACMMRLRHQTIDAPVEIVANVSPFSAALQAMVDRCDTDTFVQVDEDMILTPDAVQRMVALLDSSPPNTVMAAAPLWDADLEMLIYGLKVYRTELVRRVPFEDHALGDTHDRARWAAAGLAWARAPKEMVESVGEHGTDYTPEQAFARWRRLCNQRRLGKNIGWLAEWSAKLAQRHAATGSRRDLFALLGYAVGMTEQLDTRGPSSARENPALDAIVAMFPR